MQAQIEPAQLTEARFLNWEEARNQHFGMPCHAYKARHKQCKLCGQLEGKDSATFVMDRTVVGQ